MNELGRLFDKFVEFCRIHGRDLHTSNEFISMANDLGNKIFCTEAKLALKTKRCDELEADIELARRCGITFHTDEKYRRYIQNCVTVIYPPAEDLGTVVNEKVI